MTSKPGETVDLPRRNSFLTGAVVAVAFALLGLTAQAAAPKDATLSKEDKVCLDCHAKPGLEKTLASGEKLSLVIPAGGSASIAVEPDTVYLMTHATGLYAAVSYAGTAQLGHYAVSSAGPVSGPITIRP